MFKKWIFLLLPALTLVGCDLSEDYSDCGVLTLNFRFTNNEARVDSLQENVKAIRVYKFDDEDMLVEVLEPTAADIEQGYMEIRNPKRGTFTFSVWGGSTGDLDDSGFLEMEMDDAAAAEYRDLWADDETRLEDFYMVIDHERTPETTIPGDAAATENFADLYHAATADVAIIGGEDDQAITFDFIRNTNILKITVNGLQYLPTRADEDAPIEVFSMGENGRYKWNNIPDPDALTVHYSSTDPVISNEGKTMQVDIKILRLSETASFGNTLYLVDPATGEDLIAPLVVVEAIDKMLEATEGQSVSQEYLDDTYEFPITINFSHDLSTTIMIGEWELVTPGVEF